MLVEDRAVGSHILGALGEAAQPERAAQAVRAGHRGHAHPVAISSALDHDRNLGTSQLASPADLAGVWLSSGVLRGSFGLRPRLAFSLRRRLEPWPWVCGVCGGSASAGLSTPAGAGSGRSPRRPMAPTRWRLRSPARARRHSRSRPELARRRARPRAPARAQLRLLGSAGGCGAPARSWRPAAQPRLRPQPPPSWRRSPRPSCRCRASASRSRVIPALSRKRATRSLGWAPTPSQ